MSVTGRWRRDFLGRKLTWAVGTVLVIALLGLAISRLPSRGVDARATAGKAGAEAGSPFSGLGKRAPQSSSGEERESPPEIVSAAGETETHRRQVLDEARRHLESKQFDRAIAVLERNRDSLLGVATAYTLIGRALQGKGDNLTARDFYLAAIDRDPRQSEAYWGVATTSESLGELEAAVGAMRSYLHTEPDADPSRLRINQARSAIWEWEAKLGRGAWGPTGGIPPGFSAEELRRDGRGVGVKMPLWDSADAEGRMKYEIQHADKIKIYPRP